MGQLGHVYFWVTFCILIIGIHYFVRFVLEKDIDKAFVLGNKAVLFLYFAMLINFYNCIVKYTLYEHTEGAGILIYVWVTSLLMFMRLHSRIHVNKFLTYLALYGGALLVLTTQYMYTHKVDEVFGIKLPIEYNKTIKE